MQCAAASVWVPYGCSCSESAVCTAVAASGTITLGETVLSEHARTARVPSYRALHRYVTVHSRVQVSKNFPHITGWSIAWPMHLLQGDRNCLPPLGAARGASSIMVSMAAITVCTYICI